MATAPATAHAGTAPDAEALRRLLDGEHREIRERARELLSRPDFAPVSGLDREQYRERVLGWMRALTESGGPALGFPREFGGEGDVGGSIAAFETLGCGDLSLLVKCGVQFGLFGGALLHLGTRKHHERYLPDAIRAQLPGCFAMTESGHGSNVQLLGTTATYDADAGEFVVHTPDEQSRKDYIGNAARDGRLAVVFAQLVVAGEERGVHALAVPIRDERGETVPGVRIEDCGEKLGLNGVDNGRIWFDRVRVPRDALLDRYAQVGEDGRYVSEIENPNRRFFTMLGTLIQGRVSVGGAAISASKVALTIAIRHAGRRRQFGPPGGDAEVPLLDYRAHQRRLLPALATTYALHFAQEQLVAELHRAFSEEGYPERERRKLEAFCAGVKATATWHTTATVQTCREACGGAGYMAENRFAALKADTDVFSTFEGDNTVLLQLVAKGLLTDYRERFADLGQLELVRFVGAQVFEAVAERTLARQLVGAIADAAPAGEGHDEVEQRAYQLDLFRWREEHVLAGVARRLKRGLDAGEQAFDVFNDCQDHVIAAAQAHVDRIVLEAFAAAAERCEDPALRPLLERLCDLHALSNVERDRGWFFEHGRMSAPRSKAITRTVNRLCADLRAHADTLVDAFGIPDAVLGAPIGLKHASPR